MVDTTRLKRFLRPRHIAVIGGRWCGQVVRQCKLMGYAGEIWPVSTSHDEMAGVSCFKSLDDLPEVPDAVFIGVNRTATIDIVSKLNVMGVGGAVCFASGYAEIGATGKAHQQKLVEAAGNMPIQGPNCLGFLNFMDGVALWPDEHGADPVDKGVAILSQSGAIGLNVTMQKRHLPLSYLVSLGNQAQTGVAEFIDAMLDDDRVTAIGLLIEGLTDIPKFSAAASRALAKGVPLVALKTGRSEAGAKIAVSHTSTLAGDDELYNALFARYGVARVNTLPVFVETLKLLSLCGPLAGNKVVSMSVSGGEASMIADLAESRDLNFAEFSEADHKRISATTHELVHISNPFDYHTFDWGNREAQSRTFTEVLRSDYDARLMLLDWPRADRCSTDSWTAALGAFADAHEAAPGVSILASSLPENLPPDVSRQAIARGLIPMYGFDETLAALEAAARIGRYHRLAASGRAATPMKPVPVLSHKPSTVLDEAASKRRLAKFGLKVPEGRLVDRANVVSAASEIGFPVVLKAAGSHMTHKSDVGGVALGLTDPDAVMAAADGMADLSDSYLVERMQPKPLVELIVGITRDPQFGLVLVIGAGGILVELMQDACSLLFPIIREDVEEAIARLKVVKLLDGYRGQAAANREALIDAVMAVAQFADANADSLIELDVNPLMVFEDDAVAADALLRMS
ncbi:acetate--CoA ligase family protein [Defluviimonas sp. SAOS-178_SWC]|uniref:acetate--CoA ligase family protein n=1 Tax=Defluviimonas sp. SAOS-178_SWC TaxID=3121287 RepID=UPI003221FEC3